MGKKSSKQKSTSTPWKPAQPYLLGAAGTIQNTVNANQGGLDAIAGDMRSHLQGLGEKAFGQNVGLGAATDYAIDVLGGKYLGAGNPYLNDMASLARGNVANDINSMFGMGGRAFSDSHYQDLAKGMGEAELGLRYQDYGNERNAMTQAAGLMPSLNSSQYAGVMPYVAMAQGAAQTPYTGLGALSGLGGLFGGYGTQTGTQPGGWGTGLLGAASMAIPFIPGFGTSDRRLKTNIKWVRREPDGLDIHEFEYIAGLGLPTGRFVGPMAQDVARLRPEALGPLAGGYMTIRSSLISEAA